jgi:integrase
MPKLTLASRLHRSRHGVFGFRLVIPGDLRDRFKQREFRLSLRTRDLGQAQRQVYRLSHIALTWLDRIRAVDYEEGIRLGEQLMSIFAGAERPKVRSSVLLAAAKLSNDAQLLERATEHASLTNEWVRVQEAIEVRVRTFIAAVQGLRDEEVDSLAVDAYSELNDLKRRQAEIAWRMQANSTSMQDRAHELRMDQYAADLHEAFETEKTLLNEQAADLLVSAIQRSSGGLHRSEATDSVSIRSTELAAKNALANPGRTLSQLLTDFLADKSASKRTLRTESVDGYRDTVDLFVGCFSNLPVHAIDRNLGRGFVDKLKRLPPNRTKNPAFRNLSFAELLNLSVSKTLAPRTINKHVERLSTLLGWAERVGGYGVRGNPLKGLGVAPSSVQKRGAFTDEELERLFLSDEYRLGRFDKAFKYWIPLMGLLTGARLAEIAQLHVTDFLTVDGVSCISINETDADGKKRLKNKSSNRTVPIHPELTRLGLEDWVASLRTRGQVKLFPEIPHQAGKTLSHAPSKWFGRYRIQRGVSGNHGDFHSFRVTFISRLTNQHADQVMVKQLVGHEQGSITVDVYSRPSTAVLLETIRLFEMPEALVRCIRPYAGVSSRLGARLSAEDTLS